MAKNRGATRRAINRLAVPTAQVSENKPTAVTAAHEPLAFVPTQRYTFGLIARLELCDDLRGKKGFEQYFSAVLTRTPQLNSRAVAAAFALMQKAGEPVVYAATVGRDGVENTVYFVGPQEGLDDKIAQFRAWFVQPNPATTEQSYFDCVFTGDFGKLNQQRI